MKNNLLKRSFILRNKIEGKSKIKEVKQGRKARLFLMLLLFWSFSASSQIIPNEEPVSVEEFKKPRPEWLEKLHYGGNVWAGFFGQFYFDVSPMAGYEITKSGTIAGLGAMFIYQGQFKGTNNQVSFGPRLFVRQPIWRSFFAHAEYELVRANESQFYSYFNPTGIVPANLPKKWEGSPLVGLGLYQGRNRQQGGSFISVMYNLGYPNRGFISPQSLGGNNSPFALRLGYFF